MDAANLFYSDVGIYKLVSVHVITRLDEIKLTNLRGVFLRKPRTRACSIMR